MDTAVRESLHIAISLVMFSLLLTVIMFLSGVGQNLLTIGKEKEAFSTELAVQRDLYEYDNKTMTGDDVLRTVKQYTKLFSVSIELESSGSGEYVYLNEGSADDLWSSDSVRQRMGDSIYLKYVATLDRGISDDVTGITFLVSKD